MAEAKSRTFTKKTADGKTLTREVTGPASEVQARFDGYHEASSAAKSHTAKSGSSGSSSSSS